MRVLKHVYQLFYRRDLKLTEIRQELEQISERHPEIKLFLDIMDNTKRGIARPRLHRHHTLGEDDHSTIASE